MRRRKFIYQSAQFGLGIGLLGLQACGGQQGSGATSEDPTPEANSEGGTPTDAWFKISLAQWSLHKAFFAKELDNLDFAAKARKDFGIGGIEYVNQFFKDYAEDTNYLNQMKQRAADHDVTSVLIMVDGEGQLGDMDAKARQKAVENHYKWVEAAKYLGCHSIRVNAATDGSYEEGAKAATEGLRALSAFAAASDINVIVENHGGFSSDGEWLAGVIKNTEMANCGTLPDFGNFCLKYVDNDWSKGCADEYDRYKGIAELLPQAKAVSAKSHDFDEQGMETKSDYPRILEMVKNAGYRGWIGVEYEGRELAEDEGIRKTRDLLLRLGGML